MGRRARGAVEDDLAAVEREMLLLGLFRRYGYDLREYDSAFVSRHVQRRVREEGVESIARLAELVLRDREALGRFVSQLRDGRGALFSPAGFWRSFRKRLVSYLRTYPTVRVWLVGAPPEDIYTLSILLEEDLPRHVQIYATEIHDGLVDEARSGAVAAGSLREAAKEYRRSGGRKKLDRYFETSNGSAVLSSGLKKKIVFASHNLVTDGAFQQFQVIVARNVLAPFGKDLRERTYRLLHGSLVPLGFLALGSKDDLGDSPFSACYKPVDRSARLYQKMRETP